MVSARPQAGLLMAARRGPYAALPRLVLQQLQTLAPAVPIIYSVTLAALIVIGLQDRVPVGHIMRDPAQLARYPFYLGLVSNVGVLLWSACAAVCLFAAALTRREAARFALFSGLVSWLLALDDLFLLHESALPHYLRLGSGAEKAFEIGYIALVLALIVRFHKLILGSEFLLLVLTLAFFGASNAIDVLDMLPESNTSYLIEDSLKLLGIVSWATYFIRTCLRLVRLDRPLASAGRSGDDGAAAR